MLQRNQSESLDQSKTAVSESNAAAETIEISNDALQLTDSPAAEFGTTQDLDKPKALTSRIGLAHKLLLGAFCTVLLGFAIFTQIQANWLSTQLKNMKQYTAIAAVERQQLEVNGQKLSMRVQLQTGSGALATYEGKEYYDMVLDLVTDTGELYDRTRFVCESADADRGGYSLYLPALGESIARSYYNKELIPTATGLTIDSPPEPFSQHIKFDTGKGELRGITVLHSIEQVIDISPTARGYRISFTNLSEDTTGIEEELMQSMPEGENLDALNETPANKLS